jgi:hypothetical protein
MSKLEDEGETNGEMGEGCENYLEKREMGADLWVCDLTGYLLTQLLVFGSKI